MIEVYCSQDIKKSDVLEVAKAFESECSENIAIEVYLKDSCVFASAGGYVVRESGDNVRNAAKLTAYKVLSRATGINLAWGALTGVKPLKLVHRFINEGLDKELVKEEMIRHYQISESKYELLWNTALIQRPLLYPEPNKAALYINIPLCPSKCAYCSFPSAVTYEGSDLCEQYLKALLYELEKVNQFALGVDYDVVYIGGGTPSILNLKQIEKLLDMVNKSAPLRTELTFEAGRCDTLSFDKLKLLKDMNVSRISLNPQTSKNSTLESVGRSCPYELFAKVFGEAVSLGFESINCDLIIGLAEENEDDAYKSLEDVLKLEPQGISIHSLCKKRTSDVMLDDVLSSSINAADFQDRASGILADKGYSPYYLYRQKYALNSAENVGYSKKGKECVYNIRMMGETESVYSVGANATTKLYFPLEDRFESVFMPKDLKTYIGDIKGRTEKKISKMRLISEGR